MLHALRLGALLRQPTALVLALAFVQLLLWGVLSAQLHLAPQDDSLEQVLLSQEFRLAYGKHPPLPTWLLYGVNRIFAPSIGATFVLSALCSVATLLVLYAWARPLIGAQRAALATLLASSVEFMNAGTTYFNHNTVQLPFALLAIALFHRALTRMRLIDWALLGVGAALMLLAKFSAVVLFASFAVYLVWTRRLSDGPTLRGLGVAALVCTALIAPHLWVALHEAATPNAYAAESLFPAQLDRIERLKSVWNFGISHLAKVAPALLLFAWLRRRAPPAAPPVGQPVALTPYLTIVGFGPFVLTLVIAALSGAFLLVGWGTTFHVVLTLWLVAARPLAIEAPQPVLLRAATACIALQAVLWALVTANGGTLPNLHRLSPVRVAPAPPQLAQAVQSAWAARSAAPLHYVVSDVRTGASLAVQFRGQPRVIASNRADFAAILPPDVLAACGHVVVSARPPVAEPGAPNYKLLDALLDAAAPLSVVELRTDGTGRREFFIGVRPPASGAVCAAS
ncbi:MAG: glycosyltransferase family 39 protein [Burkholderiaceae bacterium]